MAIMPAQMNKTRVVPAGAVASPLAAIQVVVLGAAPVIASELPPKDALVQLLLL